MIIKAAALIVGFAAVFLTFRAGWVLKTLFRIENPSPEQILKAKYTAFALAAAAFAAVFLADRL